MTLTKSLLTVVALAAPLVMSAGVLAPAQAAPISAGSTIQLSSVSRTANNPGSTVQYLSDALGGGPRLSFDGLLGTGGESRIGVDAGTGTFSTALSNAGTEIKDVVFNSFSAGNIGIRNGNIANFINGIRLSPGGPIVNFTLDRLRYNANNGRGTLTGFFISGMDRIDAIGEFSTQFAGSGPGPTGANAYSFTLTAVPTPAALPALIGFGVGLVRKRKAAALAEAEA